MSGSEKYMTRKKGYYIYFAELKAGEGVSNKIKMQLKEFSKYYDIELIQCKNFSRNIVQKILSTLPFQSNGLVDYSNILSSIQEPDFIYIRRTFADKEYLKLIKTLRKTYPSCKIIIEIFTYPYDKDDFGLHRKLTFLYYPREVFYRRKLKKYIDRFVTYSDDSEIFGVKTIKTVNGIDAQKYSAIQHEPIDSKIHLLACAFFQKHHGYERILIGLKNYYKMGEKKDYIIDFVGIGPELKKYKKISNCKELTEHVKFYGKKSGKELDNFYTFTDIGLSSFSMHKLNISVSSALKTREYLTRGIPFIAGSKTDVMLENKCPYYLEFPANDSPVDFNIIDTFYDKIEEDRKKGVDIPGFLHSFAEDHCTMEKSMEPVIQFINS